MGERLHISRKVKMIIISVIAVLILVIAPVYAWYAVSRLSRTENLTVDMPPIIYIKDDNLQEVTSFNLDGLKIGEPYDEVFCVSPALIGSVDNFFLGVIYTENLGMTINIYPVYSVTDSIASNEGISYATRDVKLEDGAESVTCYFNFYKEQGVDSSNIADQYTYKETYGNWENENKPGEGNLNYGVYKAYRDMKFSAVQSTPDNLMDKMNDTSRYRFFILSITWSDTGVENAKEADIVYIVTRGKQ